MSGAMKHVQPNELLKVMNHLSAGGAIMIGTMARWTKITQKTVATFKKAGYEVLTEDGKGYRLRNGKSTVYIFAGDNGQIFYAPGDAS